MEWTRKTKDKKWHRYFAWTPVYCSNINKMVWLRFVQRRITSFGNNLDIFDDVEFKL